MRLLISLNWVTGEQTALSKVGIHLNREGKTNLVMTNTSSYTVWHISFKEKIQMSYLTMLVTLFKIPKESIINAFWLWKASWWLTIKIKTPLRSTMCNWRDDKNKPLRVAVKFFTKQNEVCSFPPRYLFTLRQKRPNILEETLREISDAQEMLHAAYHRGGETHTHVYRNKPTEKQKFVWGGVICRNHLINGKRKQTRFT